MRRKPSRLPLTLSCARTTPTSTSPAFLLSTSPATYIFRREENHCTPPPLHAGELHTSDPSRRRPNPPDPVERRLLLRPSFADDPSRRRPNPPDPVERRLLLRPSPAAVLLSKLRRRRPHLHLRRAATDRLLLPSLDPTAPPPPTPLVKHQKAGTIRNDANLKKETLKIEPDEKNPGRYLVAFTFDATVSGSISVLFFAKEGLDCNLLPTKDGLLAPVIVSFNDGLGQKFKLQSGTGIDFSMFEEAELIKEGKQMCTPWQAKQKHTLLTNKDWKKVTAW